MGHRTPPGEPSLGRAGATKELQPPLRPGGWCGILHPQWSAIGILVLCGSAQGADKTPAQPAQALACDPSEFHVAIDVGHGPGGGATSARGVPEYDFNRRQAVEIESALHEAGFFGSFLLDPDGVGLQLRDRPARAAALGADLLLSVHHDSVQEMLLSSWNHQGQARPYCDQYAGFCLFFSARGAQSERSRTAAEAIGGSLLEQGMQPSLYHALPIPNEGMNLTDPEHAIFRRDGLAVLAGAATPAVLMECGMIINREEEELLNEPAHRQRIADAVVCAAEALCAEWSPTPEDQR